MCFLGSAEFPSLPYGHLLPKGVRTANSAEREMVCCFAYYCRVFVGVYVYWSCKDFFLTYNS